MDQITYDSWIEKAYLYLLIINKFTEFTIESMVSKGFVLFWYMTLSKNISVDEAIIRTI